MSAPESLRTSIGAWTGTNRLFLPEEPIRDSPSNASVSLAARGKFSSIAYTWDFEGEAQEGMLLIGYAGEVVTAVFVDSWHMGDKLMLCQGQVGANETIDVRGSYAVEGSPDWGWRIVVEPGDNVLRVTMYNVTPDGDEVLGVEASYSRAA